MGRKKIAIKKTESPIIRQITYLKRSKGLIKKAYELATLCNIDLFVIMFSECGKLTTHCLPETTIEKVLQRVLITPLQQRQKVRIDNLFLQGIIDQLQDQLNVDNEDPDFKLPAAGNAGNLRHAVQAAAVAKQQAAQQQEIEHLKICLEQVQQVQSLDDLINVRMEQSHSIAELNHLGNSLKKGLSHVQEWKRVKKNTPQHVGPFLPPWTNDAQTFSHTRPVNMQFGSVSAIDNYYLQSDVHQTQQLQVQSNIGQSMQCKEDGVTYDGKTTVRESSTSTSNPRIY